jgi:hypothetical protein
MILELKERPRCFSPVVAVVFEESTDDTVMQLQAQFLQLVTSKFNTVVVSETEMVVLTN